VFMSKFLLFTIMNTFIRPENDREVKTKKKFKNIDYFTIIESAHAVNVSYTIGLSFQSNYAKLRTKNGIPLVQVYNIVK